MTKKIHAFREESMSRFHGKNEWPLSRHVEYHEMKPILAALTNETINEDIKACLRNYLVISLVSTIEDYLINKARRLIDVNDIDIRRVVRDEITIPISTLARLNKEHITKGKIVASNFNFANPKELNDFFSKMLKLEFFDVIKELDKGDPFSYFKGAGSLNRNWKLFLSMFELRNKLVHGKKPITLTDKQLTALCNCTMNFLDACGLVCVPESRRQLDEHLGHIRQRALRRKRRQQRLQQLGS